MEEQPNEDGHRTTSPASWTGSSTTMMAWSRSPWVVVMSGAFRSAWDWRRVSHLPDLTPIDFALFTRAMPAAGSGASSPLSVAATAGVRMADRIGDETLCKTRDFIRGEAHVARRDDRARATVPPRARRAIAGTLRIRSMHRFEVYDLIFRSGKRIQDAGGNHALGTAHSEKLRRLRCAMAMHAQGGGVGAPCVVCGRDGAGRGQNLAIRTAAAGPVGLRQGIQDQRGPQQRCGAVAVVDAVETGLVVVLICGSALFERDMPAIVFQPEAAPIVVGAVAQQHGDGVFVVAVLYPGLPPMPVADRKSVV